MKYSRYNFFETHQLKNLLVLPKEERNLEKHSTKTHSKLFVMYFERNMSTFRDLYRFLANN